MEFNPRVDSDEFEFSWRNGCHFQSRLSRRLSIELLVFASEVEYKTGAFIQFVSSRKSLKRLLVKLSGIEFFRCRLLFLFRQLVFKE